MNLTKGFNTGADSLHFLLKVGVLPLDNLESAESVKAIGNK